MRTVAPIHLDPAAAKAAGERLRLKQAAEAFEALMLQSLLKSMSEAQLEEGFFGGGPGASTYQGIFEEQFAEELSLGSPLGIARMLEEQWTGKPDAARAAREALRKAAEFRAREAYGAAAEAAGGDLAPHPSSTAAPTPSPAPAAEPASPPRSRVSGPDHSDYRHTSASVSSPFGWRRDPFDGSPRFHHGVDLPAPSGTPVIAVAPGEVLSVGRSGGFGLEVLVRHGRGWVTRYAHLSGTDIRPGQKVARGSLLGQVGSSGRSTGPHLHFEASRDGRVVDPGVAAPGSIRAQVLRDLTDET